MTVNFISETEFTMKDHGVHTAYVSTVEMARAKGVSVLINSLRQTDITHIHTIGPFAYYKLRTSTLTVVTAHLVPESFIGSIRGTKYWLGISRRYLRHFYNQADLVLAVSPVVKEQLVALGVTSRIEVLHNAVNSTEFRKNAELKKIGLSLLNLPLRQAGLPVNKKIVLGVGQIQLRKGVIDFIKVARATPQATFVWVGGRPFKTITASDGEMDDLLENPPNNFYLRGPFVYANMPAIFNAADIFFFPSIQETSGMVIVEAAMCGLPVILRDIPEYKPLYSNDFYSSTDLKGFVNIINDMLTDKNNYIKGLEKSQKIANSFNMDKLGDILIGYYKALLT